MKLINMKRPKPKKEKHGPMDMPEYAHEAYPYGLQLRLCTDEISKLGIDVKNMKVGSKVTIVAQADITEIRQEENLIYSGKAPKSENHIALQITDMQVATTSSGS